MFKILYKRITFYLKQISKLNILIWYFQQTIMDSFQFVENQLYPSAPVPNDVDDLSVKVSSSHRDIEYLDNASYTVILQITLS